MARYLLSPSLCAPLILFGRLIPANTFLQHWAGQDAPPTEGSGVL